MDAFFLGFFSTPDPFLYQINFKHMWFNCGIKIVGIYMYIVQSKYLSQSFFGFLSCFDSTMSHWAFLLGTLSTVSTGTFLLGRYPESMLEPSFGPLLEPSIQNVIIVVCYRSLLFGGHYLEGCYCRLLLEGSIKRVATGAFLPRCLIGPRSAFLRKAAAGSSGGGGGGGWGGGKAALWCNSDSKLSVPAGLPGSHLPQPPSSWTNLKPNLWPQKLNLFSQKESKSLSRRLWLMESVRSSSKIFAQLLRALVKF